MSRYRQAPAPIRRGSTEFECQRYCPWQADLTSMSMSAQEQIEAGVRSLTKDFGRMRQQDGECAFRNLRSGFFDVVDSEVMRIVDSGQIDCLIAASYDLALILQHSYAHGLQPWQHLDGIVITEHPKDGLPQVAHHSRHSFQRSIVGSESLAAIVACQDAQVIPQFGDELAEPLHCQLIHIDMGVADVKDRETVK